MRMLIRNFRTRRVRLALLQLGAVCAVLNMMWIGVHKVVQDSELQMDMKLRGSMGEDQRINFTIVTGANHKYFSPAFVNHVGSFCFWEPSLRIVVWDLGLTAEEAETVKTWPSVTYRRFPFERYPSHLRDLHTYAFKPVIIKQMVDELGAVLWVDAGSHISGKMKQLMTSLFQKDGYVFIGVPGNGEVTKWTHPGMFSHFKITKGPYVGKTSFAGGLNGWLRQGDIYDKILVPWEKCALFERCISPVGAHLRNHRYDQAALSLLGYTYMFTYNRTLYQHTELRDIVQESRGHNTTYMEYVKACNGTRIA